MDPEGLSNLIDEHLKSGGFPPPKPTQQELNKARQLRETEKDTYLRTNYPDARERWRKYEDLIIAKYCFTARRFYKSAQHALDEAWFYRNYYRR